VWGAVVGGGGGGGPPPPPQGGLVKGWPRIKGAQA
jgi:hypothetical protein